MSYQDDLRKHLVEYKRRHLGILEPGVWRGVQYDHILPLRYSAANLLPEAEPAASAFLAKHPAKRHQYFHHLNSSQAFAFNLFFLYFGGEPEPATALLRALGQNGILTEWEPEKVPDPEEGTNIDVFWATADRVQTFCEVKLSEADFGTARDDDPHRKKLANIYSPDLAGHLDPAQLEPQAFFAAYQFNRNIWHMVRTNSPARLIFLLPRSNTALWAILHKMLAGVVPETRKHISAVAIEDVIATLSADERCPQALRAYAYKLEQKYLPRTAN